MWMVWLLAGAAMGALNVASLWWTVTRLRPGAPTRALVFTVGGVLLRWALTAALLVAVFGQGAGPGLLALAGFWLARWVGVLWIGLRPLPSDRSGV